MQLEIFRIFLVLKKREKNSKRFQYNHAHCGQILLPVDTVEGLQEGVGEPEESVRERWENIRSPGSKAPCRPENETCNQLSW